MHRCERSLPSPEQREPNLGDHINSRVTGVEATDERPILTAADLHSFEMGLLSAMRRSYLSSHHLPALDAEPLVHEHPQESQSMHTGYRDLGERDLADQRDEQVPSSIDQKSAVDVHHLSGDERSLLGNEKEHRPRHIDWFTKTPHRDRILEVGYARDHVGVD